jgi:hypothetical protein
MDPFRLLAEARIREWLSRPEAERAQIEADAPAPVAPLEVQLYDEALALYARARQTHDEDERRALLERAARVETRLMVLLEESGRPLAAQKLAERLAQERSR